MSTSEKNVVYETISTEQWKELASENMNIPVVMYTRGISMWPLLRADRDSVIMVNPDRPLKKGDIITFLRSDGKNVTHRICKIDDQQIQTIGDNCDAPDEIITHDKVIGLVTHVNHNGREISMDSKRWQFYGKTMIATNPVRMFVRNHMFRPVRHCLWRIVKGKKK